MRVIERIIYLVIILLLAVSVFYLVVLEKNRADNGVPVSIDADTTTTTTTTAMTTKPTRENRSGGTSEVFSFKESTYSCGGEAEKKYYDLYIDNVKTNLGLEQNIETCNWDVIKNYILLDDFAILKIISTKEGSDKVYVVDKTGELLIKFEELHTIDDIYVINKAVYIDGYNYFDSYCDLDLSTSVGGLYKIDYDSETNSLKAAKKIQNTTFEQLNAKKHMCNQ